MGSDAVLYGYDPSSYVFSVRMLRAEEGVSCRSVPLDVIAGDRPSLADPFLAPACFYLELVDDGGRVLDVPGLDTWWRDVQQLEGYRRSIPDLSNRGERPATGGG